MQVRAGMSHAGRRALQVCKRISPPGAQPCFPNPLTDSEGSADIVPISDTRIFLERNKRTRHPTIMTSAELGKDTRMNFCNAHTMHTTNTLMLYLIQKVTRTFAAARCSYGVLPMLVAQGGH